MDKTHLQFQSWNVIGNTVLSNTTDFGKPFCTDKNLSVCLSTTTTYYDTYVVHRSELFQTNYRKKKNTRILNYNG